jgi:hypothetical protein
MRVCRSVYRAGPGRPGTAATSGLPTISLECLPFRPSSRQVLPDRIVFGYVRHERMMSCWQKQCSAIQHSFNEDRLVFGRADRKPWPGVSSGILQLQLFKPGYTAR